MSGWIKIYREITQHWIFHDAEKFKWWIDMIFLASYEDNKVLVGNRLVSLKRGQFMASISFFVKRWDVGKDKVINFLKLLQTDGMIDKTTDNNVSIITICNYESYQDVPDNPADRLQDNPADNLADNPADRTKEIKEVKEIYKDLTNAPASRTREENPAWDEARESGFVERFKAQGSAILIMRVTGKSPEDVMRLLDVYLASRQMKDLGHKDFNHFLEAFQYAIKNNKISIPVTPAQPKEKKVISGADIFKVYGE